jgi:transposase
VLETLAEAMLAARAGLKREFDRLERQVRAMARESAAARLLMTTPGVGVIVALDFTSAIDDASRFKSSKRVGAYFGLTQRKYQSGQKDITGRISKIGDAGVRASLHQAAHSILTRSTKVSGLKQWAQRVARRAGARRAKVALARRLAVVMHRMLVDGTPFDPSIGLRAV